MWMDLYLDTGRRHVSAGLFEQIRDAITSGRLQPGDRIPPTRELAAELDVARSTVATVYARLAAEGFIEGRAGAGSFVSATSSTSPTGGTDRSVLRPRTALEPIWSPPQSSTRNRFIDEPIDLRTGSPDPSLFPLTDWRRAMIGALQTPPPGYLDAAGLAPLRHALARWVGRSRGVDADPERVIVTSGAQQAFDICAALLLAPGDTVVVEEPGYPPARRLFEHRLARIVPVPVDAEGIVVDRIPHETRLVYTTPSHQSPTGVVMSAERRRALLDLARQHDMAIIEDDYDTEFRYVDRPLEPLHRLDADGRVIYVGTFSKTLSPSLRLGFVVVPHTLVDAARNVRAVLDVHPPHATQFALAELITSGLLDRHLRRARRTYRERHHLVTDRLTTLAADGTMTPPLGGAGLHVSVRLRPDVDEVAIVTALAARGVAINGMRPCWIRRDPPPGLLVGFGLATIDGLERALDVLADEVSRR